ncbi:hypothetical protein EV714DRAFT_220637, partial [Schizophyllum commune]
QNDDHLPHEAANYQQFPDWFFQHWSGYNVVKPLLDPTPCGALVPNFYGYYVPESPEAPSYLSPILLLEYCGVPIEPEKLSIDDKQEAAALFLLLSSAGWVQNSIAARNVLVQAGPLSDWPLMRITNVPPKSSFRLIDFGRARKVEEYPVAQETQAMELFELGIFNKGPY